MSQETLNQKNSEGHNKRTSVCSSEKSYLAFQSYGLCKLAPKQQNPHITARDNTSDYRSTLLTNQSNSQLHLPKYVAQRYISD
jgi:hypothetical protein